MVRICGDCIRGINMVSTKDSKLIVSILEMVRLIAAALAGYFGGSV